MRRSLRSNRVILAGLCCRSPQWAVSGVGRRRKFTSAADNVTALATVAREVPRPPDQAEPFVGSKAGDEREVAGVKLCWCPPGKFTMGSPRNEPERRAGEDQVEVTLTKGFWMGKYEMTQGDWKRVVGDLPGKVDETAGIGDDFPVYNVNFAEAEEFCRKLTAQAHESSALAQELGVSTSNRGPVGIRLSSGNDDRHGVWRQAEQHAGKFRGQAL